MENRHPPRSNSSDRKPSFGQGRGAPSFRDRNRPGNPPADGQRKAISAGDGRFGNDGGRRFGPGGFDKGDPKARGRRTNSDTFEREIKITCDGQITDGRFRGRTLQSSPSPKCTHTDRKLREVVFKILSRRVTGGRILDLGAGCGTIGIEALSRGAMLATFVERSARMCTLIRKNLADVGIKDGHGEVAETEILLFLKRAALRKRVWDLVYFDLPECEERKTILDGLSDGGAIKSRGLLVIEHTPAVPHPDNVKQLRRWRTIDHGERILTIYERV